MPRIHLPVAHRRAVFVGGAVHRAACDARAAHGLGVVVECLYPVVAGEVGPARLQRLADRGGEIQIVSPLP